MLVLDANVLMRAVLGTRVRALLGTYGERIEFVAPGVEFDDARRCLPEVIERRKLAQEPWPRSPVLSGCVEFEVYSGFEAIARQRLAERDEDDWPILAVVESQLS